jgi:hypothetical protein
MPRTPQTNATADRKLLMTVARSISGLSPTDWKATGPEKRRPFRQIAARVMRAISAYERRTARDQRSESLK